MLMSHHVVFLEAINLLANVAARTNEVFRENAIIASPFRSAIGMDQSGTAMGLKTEAEAWRENVAGTLGEGSGMSECQIA